MDPSPELPPPLPYGRHWIDDEDIRAVEAVLRGDWLTQGPAVEAFEAALAARCGARHAVAVSSGTAALHLACLAAGVGPGDTGITSPITFVASANCIAYCGGTPAFADINPHTVTLSAESLREACEARAPKVVIPVDFAGQPAEMPELCAVAREYGATVIEDASHALGATYEHDGQLHRVGDGAHADMTVFSFHPVKHIAMGEGGAVTTNNDALYEKLKELRTHGITRSPDRLLENHGPWYYEQQDLGFNYRVTDIQCALGTSQLRKLDMFVERRRALVQEYRSLLAADGTDVTLLLETGARRSAYHLLVAQIRGGAARRRRVFEHLRAQNILAQVHYVPVHLQPWYRQNYGYQAGDFPEAERYYEGCISLPLFPAMTDADVRRVVNALRDGLAGTS